MELITQPHLVLRLRKEYSYTSTPPLGLRGLLWGELYLYPEPAFEGGKWGDCPRPRSDHCPQTGKNFMNNEKTKFAVTVGPRP